MKKLLLSAIIAFSAIFTLLSVKGGYETPATIAELPINWGQIEGFIIKDDYIEVLSYKPPETVKFKVWVSGFNTVENQTDSSPCWAGSEYICGRDDVIACPRKFPKHTLWKIDGKIWECLDRLALKYDDRIDLNFGKDVEKAIQYGVQYKEVELLTYSLEYD